MADQSIPDDIAAMSFEDALSELEDIVRKLEKGEAKLDESITDYERGAALKAHCERKLNEAQERVEKINKRSDGKISAEPAKFD
jgi:exodeoxyribonuclease VII small subunit